MNTQETFQPSLADRVLLAIEACNLQDERTTQVVRGTTDIHNSRASDENHFVAAKLVSGYEQVTRNFTVPGEQIETLLTKVITGF